MKSREEYEPIFVVGTSKHKIYLVTNGKNTNIWDKLIIKIKKTVGERQ